MSLSENGGGFREVKGENKTYRPITFYATKEFYDSDYKCFLGICSKRPFTGSQKIREMITGFVKVNGRGQITLLDNNHKITSKVDQTVCRFCGSKKLKAIFLKDENTIPVCYNHFHEFKIKYNVWRKL